MEISEKGAVSAEGIASIPFEGVGSFAAGMADNKKPAHGGLSVWGQILLSAQSALRSVSVS